MRDIWFSGMSSRPGCFIGASTHLAHFDGELLTQLRWSLPWIHSVLKSVCSQQEIIFKVDADGG